MQDNRNGQTEVVLPKGLVETLITYADVGLAAREAKLVRQRNNLNRRIGNLMAQLDDVRAAIVVNDQGFDAVREVMQTVDVQTERQRQFRSLLKLIFEKGQEPVDLDEPLPDLGIDLSGFEREEIS